MAAGNAMTVRGTLSVRAGSVGRPVLGMLPGTADVVIASFRLTADTLESMNVTQFLWQYNSGNWNGNVTAARMYIDADDDSPWGQP